jgi:DNA-binding helix-hairpin-helix protein with protein kinase domain
MGRHPFAGRYLGLGEMPIERAIAECRFAYSRDSAQSVQKSAIQ